MASRSARSESTDPIYTEMYWTNLQTHPNDHHQRYNRHQSTQQVELQRCVSHKNCQQEMCHSQKQPQSSYQTYQRYSCLKIHDGNYYYKSHRHGMQLGFQINLCHLLVTLQLCMHLLSLFSYEMDFCIHCWHF